MDKYNKLRKLLTPPTKAGASVFTATIVSVERETCTIDLNGDRYSEVSLRVTQGNITDKLLLVPKVDSEVTVVDFNGDMTALKVIAVEQLEKVSYTVGTVSCEVDKDGYKVERAGVNLKAVIDGVVDEISKIVVVQGTSPNVPALLQLKQQIAQVLK